MNKDEIKKHLQRLHTDPDLPYDGFDTLIDNLSVPTITSIESDSKLEAAINHAIDEQLDKYKNDIRELAEKLPDGDPLRDAIEGVSDTP